MDDGTWQHEPGPTASGWNRQRPVAGWDTLALLRKRLADSLARVAEVQRPVSGELARTISGELRRPPSGELVRPSPGQPNAAPAAPAALPGGSVAASIALAQAIEIMATSLPRWNEAQIVSSAHYLRGSSFPLAPGGFFHTSATSMLRMSHAIEDAVLTHRLPCEFYAGFQRLSLVAPHIRRYQALLGCVRYLCLYGLDDVPDHPALARLRHPRTLRFVIKPRLDGSLAWYWFIAVDNPSLCTVLLARQSSGYIFSRETHTRTYDGFWTFHPPLVREIVGFLRQAGRTLFYG